MSYSVPNTAYAYTPSGTLSVSLNGKDISLFPTDLQITNQGWGYYQPGSTSNSRQANGVVVAASASNPPTGFDASGNLLSGFGVASLKENFAGTLGYYSLFGAYPSAAPQGYLAAFSPSGAAAAENGNRPGQFAVLASIGSGGVTKPGTGTTYTCNGQPGLPMRVGSADITPYVTAMVCQAAGTSSHGQPMYTAIPGVQVLIRVLRTGGASYDLLSASQNATTDTANRYRSSELVVYGQADGYTGTRNTQVFPVTGASLTPVSTGYFSSCQKACATRNYAFDPYWGRSPSALKDVTGLQITLTFPSGKVWTATLAGSALPTGGGLVSLPAQSGTGSNLALSLNTYNSASFSWTSAASSPDTDFGTAARQAALDGQGAHSDVWSPGSGAPAGVVLAETTNVVSVSSATDTSYTGSPVYTGVTISPTPLQGLQFVFVLASDFSTAAPATSLSGVGYDQDAHGRPAFLTASSSGVSLMTTKDGGHSYQGFGVASASATDASLWYDRRTGSPAACYGDGVSVISVNRAAGNGEGGDWAGGQPVAGASGTCPVWAAHPTHMGRIVLAFLDGAGNLKTLVSLQGGGAATWAALGTVATGQSFASTGRPGLCFLGDALVCVYGSGNSLLAQTSADGGATWGGPVTVAAGPYTGISCRANRRAGVVFLSASTVSGTAYTPQLWSSGNLGQTWALSPAAPPAPPSTGTALGVVQSSGRLLTGTVAYSDNAGAAWSAD